MSARTLIALVLALLLCACASYAPRSGLPEHALAQSDQWLHPGQTTQAEVEKALGRGSVLHFDSGYETWHYYQLLDHGRLIDIAGPLIGGMFQYDGRPAEELLLLWGQDGVLKKFNYHRCGGSDAQRESGRHAIQDRLKGVSAPASSAPTPERAESQAQSGN